jgi:hypothetical protein
VAQPEQAPARPGIAGFLTRRIGPAPVWVWFIVFVIAVFIFLRWRASHKGTAGTAAASQSNALTSPNLTTQSAMATPYYSDLFVNVQQPGATGHTGPTGPTGPAGPAGPQGTPTDSTATSGTTTPPAPAGPKYVTVTPADNLYATWWNAAGGSTGTPWQTFVDLNGGHDTFYSTFVFGPDKDALGSFIPHAKTTRQYRVA